MAGSAEATLLNFSAEFVINRIALQSLPGRPMAEVQFIAIGRPDDAPFPMHLGMSVAGKDAIEEAASALASRKSFTMTFAPTPPYSAADSSPAP